MHNIYRENYILKDEGYVFDFIFSSTWDGRINIRNFPVESYNNANSFMYSFYIFDINKSEIVWNKIEEDRINLTIKAKKFANSLVRLRAFR